MQLGVEAPATEWLLQKARSHLLTSAEIKHQVAQTCLQDIVLAAQIIATTYRNGGKVLLCGNGGSAADCQHIAGELVNWLSKDFPRAALPAIALSTDTSVLTAIANDSGYESVFERQVQALGKPEDTLIGISTSGSSRNVVLAVRAAREGGLKTVVLTGQGGTLVEMADVAIAVPSQNTQYIQEAHLAIEHILCELVESHLFERMQNEG